MLDGGILQGPLDRRTPPSRLSNLSTALGRSEFALIGRLQFLLLLCRLLLLAAKLTLDRLQVLLQRLTLLLRQALAVGQKLLVGRLGLLKLLAVLGFLLSPFGGDRIVELLLLFGRETLRGLSLPRHRRSRRSRSRSRSRILFSFVTGNQRTRLVPITHEHNQFSLRPRSLDPVALARVIASRLKECQMLRHPAHANRVIVSQEWDKQSPRQCGRHTVDDVLHRNMSAAECRANRRISLTHNAKVLKLQLRVFAVEERVGDLVTRATDRLGNFGVRSSRKLQFLRVFGDHNLLHRGRAIDRR